MPDQSDKEEDVKGTSSSKSESKPNVDNNRRNRNTRRPRSADVLQRRGSGGNSDRSDSSSTSMNSYQHDRRIDEQRVRQTKFDAKTVELATFLQESKPMMVNTEEAITEQHGYHLVRTGEYFNYSIVSQSNLARFSQLNKASYSSSKECVRLFYRTIKLENLPGATAFRLMKSLSISKYFGDQSRSFLKIHDIFCVNDQKLFVFHEQFTLEHSLIHRAIFNEEMSVPVVKQVVAQLASAVDVLSLYGVAHRFIRPENVIWPSHKSCIKLTSFDMAYFYWDTNQNCSIPSPKKALPIEGIAPNLLDHLPPEAFVDNYDCALVDVWSIGVCICMLLTSENPFHVTIGSACNLIGPELEQWRKFDQKTTISCEIRSLLDDIFVEADARMTVFDLVKDKRLRPDFTSLSFLKEKPTVYYRIDVRKRINIDMPNNQSGVKEAKTTRAMPSDTFAIETPDIFSYRSFEKVYNEEAIPKYRILRDASFGEELSSKVIVADNYLKATKAEVEQADADNTGNYFLVKIVQEACVPLRHWNQILAESSKIMRYFSDTQSLSQNVHRVLDMYRSEGRLFIFYENLMGHRSLHQIVRQELVSDQVLRVKEDGKFAALSQENVLKWTSQLAQTVSNLVHRGIAHRYIRPEYVFITPDGDVKVTHWEMACYAWHPLKHLVVGRTRGLQDEQDHQWNHLPPECFNSAYESLCLDLWSVSVLVVYCLTGQYPFNEVPLSMATATEQWEQWKQSDKGQIVAQALEQLVSAMDQVFVPAERRISPDAFVSLLSANKTKQTETKPQNLPAIRPAALEPKERKSTDIAPKARKTSNTSLNKTGSKNRANRTKEDKKDDKKKRK